MKDWGPGAWRRFWLAVGVLGLGFALIKSELIGRSDFTAYYEAGLRVLSGGNLFAFHEIQFKYPPAIAILFVPFTALEPMTARRIFVLISLALTVDTYRRARRRFGDLPTAIGLVSVLRFHHYDLLNIQVNHLLLWGLVAFLDLRDRESARLRRASSGIFALTASFKLMPLLALGPLFLQGRIRETLRIALLVAGIAVIPGLVLDEGFRQYGYWFQRVLEQEEFPAPSPRIIQSVQSMLWFFLREHLGTTAFVRLMITTQLALLGGLAFCAWRVRAVAGRTDSLLICAAITLSVVINPLAWKHNYLLLLPGICLLAQAGWTRVLIAQFLLMTAYPALVAPFSAEWADRAYTTVIGALLIFFTLLRESSRRLDASRHY